MHSTSTTGTTRGDLAGISILPGGGTVAQSPAVLDDARWFAERPHRRHRYNQHI